jgi:RND family efflux transporter MFP subunit
MSSRSFLLSVAPIAVLLAGSALAAPAAPASPAALSTVTAEARSSGVEAAYDGVVEAVRQTTLAAQVAGAIVQLEVKPGDVVKAGQLLVRIDARAAQQNALSGDAAVRSARASLDLATKDFERQKQLRDQNYISQAALERAEAQFKATQAQVAAQLAQAGAAHTEAGLSTIRAPYAGVVSDVPVSLGDMALPGRALLTLYDPRALRVSAFIPQSAAAQATQASARIELPGLPAAQQWQTPVSSTVLPASDPGSHTQQLRLDLPTGLAGAGPGSFARVWLALKGSTDARVFLPAQAIVRRAELSAVYVINEQGRASLRQVRVGRSAGDRVEVLSGLRGGERVALDPQAAARQP